MFSNHFDRYDLDLSDPNVLREHFNVTLEDVWYFAPRILHSKPYSTVICLIWTSPFSKPRDKEWTNSVRWYFYKILHIGSSKIALFDLSFFIFFKVEIVIKNPLLHTIEAHEIDQSTHNYYINQMKTDYIVPKTVAITKFGKQTLTTKLKKSNDCNQEKLKVSKCLKENTSVCIWTQTQGKFFINFFVHLWMVKFLKHSFWHLLISN